MKADKVIEPEPDGSWDLRKVRHAILLHGMNRGGVPGGAGGGVPVSARLVAIREQQAQEELEWTRAKRMKAQQDLAREAGELLLYSDVLRGWAELAMNFRDALLSVGDQIALQCAMKPAREIAGILRAAHERILQELADGGGRLHASLATKQGRR